ncbi:ABC transporter ATP-binding protein [Desulfosarcina ovata]|uniref:Sugar ABC transporter n=1 Tax=Desulfosarcina ovata subsp. ovata TaxID=2752305 RepID=A0A5K8ACK0_9BACT|nr:ABC transporter ATP-binding protein [Desulfosarcina ovata]BBO90357.1 sugar ABC transporter [Desulfosarcina ovata subsp. ovata]
MSDSPPLLEMRGITKHFGSVTANAGIDLILAAGEIVGLLGENGAGKTTLMNILFGAYDADAGTIRIDGRPAAIHSSADALALGVGMVHQHYHLVPSHTVLENLMVGQHGSGWRLNQRRILRRMEEIRYGYGLYLDPSVLAGELTVGQQQRLEIIKALVRGARILILDEPTAALTPQEADGLFQAMAAMAENGMGVIFISHKLNEVRRITTRVVILRQGQVAATVANDAGTSRRQLAELMCGRTVTPPEKRPARLGKVLLTLENIHTANGTRQGLKGIDLSVHAGEIVGVAGVSGNGQKELADVVAGVLMPSGGRMVVASKVVAEPSPKTMQGLGIGRIPEDRMGTGLITTLPLASNLVLPRIRERRFSRFGFLKLGAIRQFAQNRIAQFGIKTAGSAVRAGTLSGGNLQKALLARELAWNPRVLLAAQPTRGLDVSAAGFVHEQFLNLRQQGSGVLVISEDLEELFLLSDRIAVMFEGRIMATLPIEEASVERIGLLMAGVREAA